MEEIGFTGQSEESPEYIPPVAEKILVERFRCGFVPGARLRLPDAGVRKFSGDSPESSKEGPFRPVCGVRGAVVPR